ncbi:hypothetical protein ACA910_015827 [Epithemia clementina (nom. ined.)]
MFSIGPVHVQSTGSARNLSSSRRSRAEAMSSSSKAGASPPGAEQHSSLTTPEITPGYYSDPPGQSTLRSRTNSSSINNVPEPKPKAINSNDQIFGMSKFLAPAAGSRLYGELEFKPFAPCLTCPCICCQFFVAKAATKRFYARVYENRLEYNLPCFPCLCCTQDVCITDSVSIKFFDKFPNKAGTCCYCIPCICCGPPVISSRVPRCCCAIIDCRPCFGEVISVALCSCFDCRACICFGPPCYECCNLPLFPATVASEEFLAIWRTALDDYALTRNVPSATVARFRRLADRACCCDSMLVVDQAPRPLKPIVMDRDPSDYWFIRGSLKISSSEAQSTFAPVVPPRPVTSNVIDDRGGGGVDGNEMDDDDDDKHVIDVKEDTIETKEEVQAYEVNMENEQPTFEPAEVTVISTATASGLAAGAAAAEVVKKKKKKKKKATENDTEFALFDETENSGTENIEDDLSAAIRKKKKKHHKKKSKHAQGEDDDMDNKNADASESNLSASPELKKKSKKKKSKKKKDKEPGADEDDYSSSTMNENGGDAPKEAAQREEEDDSSETEGAIEFFDFPNTTTTTLWGQQQPEQKQGGVDVV